MSEKTTTETIMELAALAYQLEGELKAVKEERDFLRITLKRYLPKVATDEAHESEG